MPLQHKSACSFSKAITRSSCLPWGEGGEGEGVAVRHDECRLCAREKTWMLWKAGYWRIVRFLDGFEGREWIVVELTARSGIWSFARRAQVRRRSGKTALPLKLVMTRSHDTTRHLVTMPFGEAFSVQGFHTTDLANTSHSRDCSERVTLTLSPCDEPAVSRTPHQYPTSTQDSSSCKLLNVYHELTALDLSPLGTDLHKYHKNSAS